VVVAGDEFDAPAALANPDERTASRRSLHFLLLHGQPTLQKLHQMERL
jgi:hypothetical protein